MTKNLQPVLTELHKGFELFNKHFYEGKLPEVVIAIRSQGKRKGVLGWFTPAKVWTDGEDEKHEIVITAETLNRPYMDIMRTLHHEMIHLYCESNDIQDTSRQGKYHNKNFRDESLKRGFYYPDNKPDATIGWSFSQLKPETEELVKSWELNESVFGIARKSFGGTDKGTKKKSNRIKWTCPSCKAVISSTKLEGIKPYCMNDMNTDGSEKEPCHQYFVPEIPDNFNGKIPLTELETQFVEWMVEYLTELMENTGEPDFYDIMIGDFEDNLGYEMDTIKGVLGSLVKKKMVVMADVNGEYNVYGLSVLAREQYGLESTDRME